MLNPTRFITRDSAPSIRRLLATEGYEVEEARCESYILNLVNYLEPADHLAANALAEKINTRLDILEDTP